MKRIKRFITPLIFAVAALFVLAYLSGIYQGAEVRNDALEKDEEHPTQESIRVNTEEYVSSLCASGDGVISDGIYNGEEYFFCKG